MGGSRPSWGVAVEVGRQKSTLTQGSFLERLNAEEILSSFMGVPPETGVQPETGRPTLHWHGQQRLWYHLI